MNKVITVAQQKGGAGKTTVSAHLSVAFSQKGFKVAALDIDPQASLTDWYNIRKKDPSEKLSKISFKSLPTWWQLVSEIEELKANHDIVVIDCPPHTKSDAVKAVKYADLVVVPIQPSPTDLWSTCATIGLTNKENANSFLLLNRVVRNSKLAKQFLEDFSDFRLKNFISSRIALSYAMGGGKCVTETQPKSEASQEIFDLSDEILEILENIEANSELLKEAS